MPRKNIINGERQRIFGSSLIVPLTKHVMFEDLKNNFAIQLSQFVIKIIKYHLKHLLLYSSSVEMIEQRQDIVT